MKYAELKNAIHALRLNSREVKQAGSRRLFVKLPNKRGLLITEKSREVTLNSVQFHRESWDSWAFAFGIFLRSPEVWQLEDAIAQLAGSQ